MSNVKNKVCNKNQVWLTILILLSITATCVAIIVKGFHLFSDTRLEPYIQGADDSHYFVWLRSWVVDGDLNFENDFKQTPFLEDSAKKVIAQQPRTETGLVHNKYPVGWAVMNYPLFFLAHKIAPLFGWQNDGFSPPYQIAILAQQLMIAALGFFLALQILKHWFDGRTALLAILATWLISPMIYYQTARISMVHNVLYVSAIIAMWAALKIKDHLEKANIGKSSLIWLTALASFQSGIMVICRPSAIVYLILPIVIIIRSLWFKRTTEARFIGMLILLAFAFAFIGVFPQLAAWKIVNGHWIYYSYEGEGFNWGSPQLWVSLMGDHHGLFNWHPLLLVGLLALFFASWRGDFYHSWIVTLILIAWTNAAWHMVYFGSSFGGRAYEFLVFFSTIGMAFLIDWAKNKKRLLHVILFIFSAYACWNILFMYLFMQGLVSREEPVSWFERLQAVTMIF